MIYDTILAAVKSQLSAALPPDVDVQRGRARAVAEEQQLSVRIGMNVTTAQTYTTGGSIEYRVDIRIACLARSTTDEGDVAAAQLHGLVHNALRADNTLGIPGLTLDLAFTATDEIEDLDESLAGVVAVYTAQICTEDESAD